jgi:hypothetical protein
MSESIEDIELENKPVKEVKEVKKAKKREFGHYEVIVTKGEKEEKEVVKPITQDDIAEGWQATLPKMRKRQPIHHWSVTLAQLPPHLWDSIKTDYKNNKSFIPIIREGNYFYSVNQTKYDETFRNIYDELLKGYKSDNDKLKELGWIINTDFNTGINLILEF